MKRVARIISFCAVFSMYTSVYARVPLGIRAEELNQFQEALNESQVGLTQVIYTLAGRGGEVLDAAQTSMDGIRPEPAAIHYSLSLHRLDTRKLYKERVERWRIFVEREPNWEKSRPFLEEVVLNGTVTPIGRFLVFRVTAPAGVLDMGSVEVERAFYRVGPRMAWERIATSDEWWTLNFRIYPVATSPVVKSGKPALEIRQLETPQEIGRHVREWIRETPELLLAQPFLSCLLE